MGPRGQVRRARRAHRAMDPEQLYRYVIRPTLDHLRLLQPGAGALVLGTGLVESKLTHVRQARGGPALGVFQMEPNTHDSLWMNWLSKSKNRGLAMSIRGLVGNWPLGLEDQDFYPIPSPTAMQGNLYYATAMARVHYRQSPLALPPADAEALAWYWKKVYNTLLGKGTVAKALPFFKKAVLIASTVDAEDLDDEELPE